MTANFLSQKNNRKVIVFSLLPCSVNKTAFPLLFTVRYRLLFSHHPSPLYFSPFQLSVRSTVHHHDWVCWGCRCQREQQETRHHRVYQPDKQLLPHQPKVRPIPEAKLMLNQAFKTKTLQLNIYMWLWSIKRIKMEILLSITNPQVKSSQVTFIYIALLTIQIVKATAQIGK